MLVTKIVKLIRVVIMTTDDDDNIKNDHVYT